MKQYINLGSSPTDEESCSQTHDHERIRKECLAYRHQLWRMIDAQFGEGDHSPFEIEIGAGNSRSYLEVFAVFTTGEVFYDKSVFFGKGPSTKALWLAENIPSKWDEEAAIELGLSRTVADCGLTADDYRAMINKRVNGLGLKELKILDMVTGKLASNLETNFEIVFEIIKKS